MKHWKKLAFALMLGISSAHAAQELDRVVAIVNNNVILESDVNSMMQAIKQNAKINNQSLPDNTTLRHQILNRLIINSIVLEQAKKLGIKIDDQALSSTIKNIAQQNHISVDELKKRLKAQGINFATYQQQIRQEMMMASVRNAEVGRLVTVSPQDVDALAKVLATQFTGDTEFNLSQILLPLPQSPTAEDVKDTQQTLSLIMEQLKNGADFKKMAIAYSSGPESLQGGDLGWSKLSQLPPAIAEELQSAKKGSIIGPIQSSVGLHLFKVNAIRATKPEVSVIELHTRHILIRPSLVLSNQQARKKIDDIAQQIQKGASFAALASQYSEDPASAAKGGDLGWVPAQTLDPVYRDTALKLTKGEISKPVRTSFGWDIIQLIDKRTVDKTQEALQQQAYSILFNRKFEEESMIWVQEQRANAYVKIINDSDKSSTIK